MSKPPLSLHAGLNIVVSDQLKLNDADAASGLSSCARKNVAVPAAVKLPRLVAVPPSGSIPAVSRPTSVLVPLHPSSPL